MRQDGAVNLSRIDLNLLVVFDTILTREGVSRAARHLNLSQPAVSHALAKLRGALGDPLFVRQGNRLVPTAAARALAGPVREALRGLESALADRAGFDPQTSTREFRIGLRPTGEAPRFARLVNRMQAQAPHVTLTSVSFRRRDVLQALASGACDLVIDIDLPHDERLRRAWLDADTMVVVTRAGHPAASGGLTLEAYLAEGHVFASPRPSGAGVEDIALGQAGQQRRIAVRCQNITTACQIVAEGDLLYTLPQRLAATYAPIWGLAVHPLPFAVPLNPISVYWHRDADGDPAIAWLRDLALGISPDGASSHSST